MLTLNYRIDKVASQSHFGTMVAEALDKLGQGEGRVPLRLVFFGDPASNKEYLEQRLVIVNQVAERYGGLEMPLVTYVAQKPLDAGLVVESHWEELKKDKDEEYVTWTRKMYKRTNYVLMDVREGRWLFTEGILPTSLDAPIREQSEEVLRILGEILAKEKMPVDTIVRQWNYIERITYCGKDGMDQHYQDFNDARSEFYKAGKWKEGYPAATGIGTKLGGLMVEADAMESRKKTRSEVVALDNELQVAAHDYSQKVLVGRESSTPKFERAKAIVLKHKKAEDDILVHISGTAAIRGEDSLTGVGIEEQTVTTLENIEQLISPDNLRKHGIKVEKEPKIKNFRVYLKSEDLFEEARRVVEQRYPQTPALYVLTDVCRDELLVEIEGVALTW